MKTIIAGYTGNDDDVALVEEAVEESGFEITEVVSGGIAGAYSHGEKWAHANGKPTKVFWPVWKKHGNAAVTISIQEMINYADAMIVVFNGSIAVKDAIARATHKGLRIFIKRVSPK